MVKCTSAEWLSAALTRCWLHLHVLVEHLLRDLPPFWCSLLFRFLSKEIFQSRDRCGIPYWGLHTGAPEGKGHCGDGVGAVPMVGHRLVGLIGPHGLWSPGAAKKHGFGLRKGWLLLEQGLKLSALFILCCSWRQWQVIAIELGQCWRVFEPSHFEKPCRCWRKWSSYLLCIYIAQNLLCKR